MTKKEQQAILDLSLKRITLNSFSSEFPNSINKEHILNELRESHEAEDYEVLEYALLLGFILNIFDQSFVSILCRIITQRWHYKHEDIALILQQLRAPESVDALYKTALEKFEYLLYDENYALARKCIHALGAINTTEAKERLKQLATSEIAIIREKATKQLNGRPH